ncbi:hypothetical protein FJT64_010008 [Amphibalanus amphitrite]|uniref:DRBM domain-containing protein n=1 Tax=Amphibalanus amphitrite TaxID=1232801 RepID=A0A6A4V6S0_AMPAM|nr:hypothetical protein FJT64_010008 [Amphibalanus amphitrite]
MNQNKTFITLIGTQQTLKKTESFYVSLSGNDIRPSDRGATTDLTTCAPQVTVNSVTYQPSMDSSTKKVAKASAAAACLQALGLLPSDA